MKDFISIQQLGMVLRFRNKESLEVLQMKFYKALGVGNCMQSDETMIY